MKKAFYLEYRPKKLSELDSKEIRDRLQKLLSSEIIPHAFLFAGPRGTGKTSAARIVGKSLNCLNSDGIEPCGECDICQEIARGECLDVLEIDAASNRGIDDIRQLRDKVNFQPIKARRKVYIIDEVHMLTTEAFNALLKTLEEPPSHCYFILCTTNPEKIPETVLSRLVRINFSRATADQVAASVKKVIDSEKIKIDQEAIDLVVGLADGSFRDAHKILYQLWLELGNKISYNQARKILGKIERSKPKFLLELLGKGREKEAISLLEELSELGVDFTDYGRRLVEMLKNMILFHYGGRLRDEIKEVAGLAEQLNLEKTVILSRLVVEAINEAKTAVVPQLPFQLAVVSFFEEKHSHASKKTKLTNTSLAKTAPLPQSAGLESIKSRWDRVLEEVKPMNHSVSALLRACRPFKVEGERLVLEVFYQFHKDRLSEEKNRRIVEQGLKKVFGIAYRVNCVLGKAPPRPAPVATKPKPSVVSGKDNKQDNSEKTDEDLYKIAKDIFGG
jgi:DNA polymerase-3 subunit gamma/tau